MRLLSSSPLHADFHTPRPYRREAKPARGFQNSFESSVSPDPPDSVTRELTSRGSIVTPNLRFFSLPLPFPSDKRAYKSRSSNAAPLFRTANAPWTSQNICYGHEERKVTASIYARRARCRPSSWHSHLSSRASNKEGSLGAIPTTARVAHHLISAIDVCDHQGWSGDQMVDTRWWTSSSTVKICVARAFLSTSHCILTPNPFSVSCSKGAAR